MLLVVAVIVAVVPAGTALAPCLAPAGRRTATTLNMSPLRPVPRARAEALSAVLAASILCSTALGAQAISGGGLDYASSNIVRGDFAKGKYDGKDFSG